MSEAKVLGEEERQLIVSLAQAVIQNMQTPGLGIDYVCVREAENELRWDATLCQTEEVLAGVTAERDQEWNARGVAQAALAKVEAELTEEKLQRIIYGGQVHSCKEEIGRVDAQLAEVTKERDAYKAFVDWWLGGESMTKASAEVMPAEMAMEEDDARLFRVVADQIKALEVTS